MNPDGLVGDIAQTIVLGHFISCIRELARHSSSDPPSAEEDRLHLMRALARAKHDLKTHDFAYKEKIEKLRACKMNPTLRRRLMVYESKFTKHYFDKVFSLFPEKIRPEGRRTFKAYDGTNNLFNLAYEMLSWKVHRALIKAKLEPYLGFLHSTQYGKPSLVCDFQELYRHLIDDFLIHYSQTLKAKDFIVKTEDLSQNKKGKRVYLDDSQTRDLMKQLDKFFESFIEVPRIRVGKKQTFETLINEEALLLAKFLRNEQKIWLPRLNVRFYS